MSWRGTYKGELCPVGGPIMDYREYCALIQKNYPRRHPHLYRYRESILVPSLSQALAAETDYLVLIPPH